MALSDYAHHNEDAAFVWFQEEGRWENDPSWDDPYDD